MPNDNTIPASDAVFQFFRQNDSDGVRDLASTASHMHISGLTTDGGPVDFYWGPFEGYKVELQRINWQMADTAMQWTLFGALAALDSDTRMDVGIYRLADSDAAPSSDDTLLLDFMDGEGIRDNLDFGALTGVDSIVVAAAGPDAILGRHTLSKALSGESVSIGYNEYARVRVNGNLGDLTKLRAFGQGQYIRSE